MNRERDFAEAMREGREIKCSEIPSAGHWSPTVLLYRPNLRIRNLEHLPHGAGCRFLEVMRGEDGDFIATRWRRTAKCADDRLLIEFPKRRSDGAK